MMRNPSPRDRSRRPARRRGAVVCAGLCAVFALGGARAEVPGPMAFAAALAAPDSREEVSFAALALLDLRDRAETGPVTDPEAEVARFNNDMLWLRSLDERFGAARPATVTTDPAQWLIDLELDQHGLATRPLVALGETPLGALRDQVFDRGNPRLAATLLPEVLYRIEPEALPAWQALLAAAEDDGGLAETLGRISDETLAVIGIPEGSGEALGQVDPDAALAEARASLDALLVSATGIGPPDPFRLQNLRFTLLTAIPGMGPEARADAADLLSLATLLDGLHERRYLDFAGGLLALATDWLDAAERGGAGRVASAWLAGTLAAVSDTFARPFAEVDPRLNAMLAAVFDVVQNLDAVRAGTDPARPFRRELADAASQLMLMVPDLGFYFDQPVRRVIAEEIDVCISIASQQDAGGAPEMTREQFDGCLESLVRLAETQARSAELAGDPDGPFGIRQLHRELTLTPWQRLNYGIGFLHDRYETGCALPAQPLPNPLEWATLANLLAWFADRAPVFFNTPENAERLERMRQVGQELVRNLSETADCIAGASAGVADPVVRVLGEYRSALDALSAGMERSELAFREERLAPGSDIDLARGAGQTTAYRPEELAIGPCAPERICEMSGTLDATRALIGLFPDTHLVAHQSSMGSVEICYDNVRWTQRRSERVREDDDVVANYYGKLAFDLRGRFVETGGTSEIFGFRMTSPEEHHYLFGPATDEVLADECPTEWVGTRIVTPLPPGRIAIVPDRLTYLCSARTLPSRLFAQNWDRGAEWRDRFVTGIGVEDLGVTPDAEDGLAARLEQHLRVLYREQQEAVYDAALKPDGSAGALDDELFALSTMKSLLRVNLALFYPEALVHSDRLRGALAGQGGLLDRRILERLREANLPAAAARADAYARLEAFLDAWRAQPEVLRRNGTIAPGTAHALTRLGELYRRFFAERPVSRDYETERSPW